MTALLGQAILSPLDVLVPASSSIDADALLLSEFCAVKYLICFSDDPATKWSSLEMFVGKNSISGFEDSQYGALGDSLNINANFSLSGSEGKLVLTNNEIFPIRAKISRHVVS